MRTFLLSLIAVTAIGGGVALAQDDDEFRSNGVYTPNGTPVFEEADRNASGG